MENLSGRVIKGYELKELIGEGGFGAVYMAVQRFVGREVAVKIILPQHANHPDFIRRFETEAQLIARLEHPHIVPLYDYWREPSGAYLVMRYLRGGSVHHSLHEEGYWDTERISPALSQIASALVVAHRQGIVHRDLKPENILLDENGNAYLSDFGIAKDLVAQDNITRNNAIVGSPAYISPEQIRGQAVTPQSDIYMLGVLLYEMLTGMHPFADHTTATLMYKHLSEPIPDLTTLRPELPDALNQVLQRATAKDPDDRYSDALELARAFRRAIHTGRVGDEPSQTAYITSDSLSLPEPENPYKGLRAFQQADTADFFGREQLSDRLIARLQEDAPNNNFLAVIGPSGSGKSSVIKAGLMPRLQQGALPGSENWFFVEMVPSIDPMEELEAALLRVAVNPPETLLKQLNEDERGFLRAAKRILPDDATRLFVLIDQFEEIFTLVDEEDMRRHFMDSLMAAISDPRSPVTILITLRADFFDRPLNYNRFGDLLQRRTEIVLPLTADEIERAITGPAERAGLVLERGLVAAIAADTTDQPGGLPLLQYALTELFERREGRTLTLKAYHDIGGALGALAQRADELYSGLGDEGQEVARQVFLRLVTLGEGTEDTRRRILQSELRSLGDNDMVEMVVDAFGRYRLLTFDNDPITRASTVEVAHEALIRRWNKLRDWLADSREDLRLQRRLADAAEEWRHSQRDGSFLARGSRLTQFEEWSRDTTLLLNDEEREYLNASIQQRKAREAEERARQAREEALEQQSRNRLRALVAVLTAAVVIALGLTAFAFSQNREAQLARLAAERNQEETNALALAANARNALIENDPMLALSLAIEAGDAFAPPPVEVSRVLATSAFSPGVRARLTGHSASVTDTAYSPDGLRAVSASADGTLRLWDTVQAGQVRSFGQADTFYTSAVFHPDGTRIASSEVTPDGLGRVKLWDTDRGELLREFTAPDAESAHSDTATQVVFSQDGRFILSGSLDRSMILWNAESGEIVQRFDEESAGDGTFIGGILAVDISPNGRTVVSGHVDETIANTSADRVDRHVRLWDVNSGRINRDYDPELGYVRAVDFSPDGRFILAASWNSALGGVVTVWNTISLGTPTQRLFADANVITDADFSADGERVIVASWGRSLSVWDRNTGAELQRFSGFDDRILSLAASSDGQHVLIGSGNIGGNEIDQEAENATDTSIWMIDLQDRAEIRTLTGHEDWVWEIDLSADGRVLASGGGSFNTPVFDARVHLWDAVSGASIKTLGEFVNAESVPDDPSSVIGHTSTVDTVAINADGSRVLSGGWDQQLILWDVESGAEIRRFAGHTGRIYTADIHPNGRFAISGDNAGNLFAWDLDTGEQLRSYSGGHEDGTSINHLVFDSDGARFLSSGDDQTIIMWDFETGEVLQSYSGHEDRVNNAIFSPDESRIASTSWDATVRLWDTASGAQLRLFTGHASETFGIAFSPDNSTLISGSSDQTARLWDINSGDELGRLSGHTSWLQSIAYDPNGAFAITGAQDNLIKVWRVSRDVDDLIDFIDDNRYTRPLTCAEQERYRLLLDTACGG